MMKAIGASEHLVVLFPDGGAGRGREVESGLAVRTLSELAYAPRAQASLSQRGINKSTNFKSGCSKEAGSSDACSPSWEHPFTAR